MARLQKKKTERPRKKKPASAENEAAAATEEPGSSSAVASASAPPTEVKKSYVVTSKKSLKASRSEPGKIAGYVQTAVQFLREVKVELKKVTWPSRKQTVGSTVVVLILVTIIALFLGVADIALSGLIRVVLQ